MREKIKQFIREAGVLSLALSIAFIITTGVFIAKGWTEPTSNPPGGNLGAPINTSAIGQNKAGALGVSGIFSALSGIKVGTTIALVPPAGIRSQGDICTDAGGGKCLSSAGGGGANIAHCRVGSSSGPFSQRIILNNCGLADQGSLCYTSISDNLPVGYRTALWMCVSPNEAGSDEGADWREIQLAPSSSDGGGGDAGGAGGGGAD